MHYYIIIMYNSHKATTKNVLNNNQFNFKLNTTICIYNVVSHIVYSFSTAESFMLFTSCDLVQSSGLFTDYPQGISFIISV